MDEVKIEDLRSLAVSICKDGTLAVILDKRIPVPYARGNTIFLTTNGFPSDLPENVKIRLLDALVMHEASHVKITRLFRDIWERLITEVENPFLMKFLINIEEDYRGDHFLMDRYRLDLGRRIHEYVEFYSRSIITTLKVHKHLTTKNYLLLALYGYRSKELEKSIPQEDLKIILEVAEILRETTRLYNKDQIYLKIKKAYDLIKNRIIKVDENPERFLFKPHGERDYYSDPEMREILEKQAKESDKEAKKEKSDQRDQIKSIGAGSGREIPMLYGNKDEYLERLSRLQDIINRLLEKLRKTIKTETREHPFQRSGRIMSNILGDVYTNSLRRPVDYVYYNIKKKVEKEDTLLAFIMDMSGSMSLDKMKDLEIVFIEVFGRYLRSEDYLMLVFGSEYSRIKDFSEEYHNTRYRITGITSDYGGTELYSPLLHVYKILKSIRTNKKKVIVIASDFFVSRPHACKELCNEIRDHGINILGVGYCDSSSSISEYTNNYTVLENIDELPERFVDLYIKLV